jgi:hypothetical protein
MYLNAMKWHTNMPPPHTWPTDQLAKKTGCAPVKTIPLYPKDIPRAFLPSLTVRTIGYAPNVSEVTPTIMP